MVSDAREAAVSSRRPRVAQTGRRAAAAPYRWHRIAPPSSPRSRPRSEFPLERPVEDGWEEGVKFGRGLRLQLLQPVHLSLECIQSLLS